MVSVWRVFGVMALAAQVLVAQAAPAAARSMIEAMADTGTFNILLTAIKGAGLTETLSGPGPYTLFAPSDDAFGKLPRSTMESLFRPEGKQKLKELLTYHLVAGTILSRDVKGKRMEAQSIQGQPILIDATRSIMVETAHLTKPDIKTDNGVIHVIDTVMMPK
jgi:uncharacterized surface protein with fasciclin (FAS1) repeats